MNKKMMMLGWAVALGLASQANAGIFDEVNNAADLARLKTACTDSPWESCQVVREAVRTRTPQDIEAPIWREISVYQLIKATPTQIAAAFADYTRYRAMFSDANLVAANVVAGGVRFPQMTVDFTLRVEFAIISQDTNYTLINNWSQNAGGYRIAWTMDHSDDVHWIVGSHDIEPVTVDGQAMTLVKYYNYINPKTMRTVLNSNLARNENKKQISRLVNLLRSWTEGAHGGALDQQVAGFCGRWQCQR